MTTSHTKLSEMPVVTVEQIMRFRQAAMAVETQRDEFQIDAMRYRWLRSQHWTDNTLAVVPAPKEAVKLGYLVPSGELLDSRIDEAKAGVK